MACPSRRNRERDRLGTRLGVGRFCRRHREPPDTVYGITTAIAIEGLLRAHEITGIRSFRATALEAADYYRQFMTPTEDGAFFWYSDRAVDAHNVNNSSSMLAGAFAMAAEESDRADLGQAAEQAYSEVMAQARQERGYLSWGHSDRRESPNDLVHAAYIVHGVLSVNRRLKVDAPDPSTLRDYIVGFHPAGGPPMEFRPDEAPAGATDRRARTWGIGMGAAVLAELERADAAHRMLSAATEYMLPEGFAYHFGGDFDVPRSTAHLLLGAAFLEAER